MLRLSLLLAFITTIYSQACNDPNCSPCDSMDPDICLNCVASYTLSGTACYYCPLNLNCNTCNANNVCFTCNTGFTNYGGTCYACGPDKAAECITCLGSSTNCPGCGGQATYFYINSCVSTCPSGTYTDTANLECGPCASGCRTCFGSSLDECNSCTNTTLPAAKYYKLPNLPKCVSGSCGNYYYGVDQYNLCLPCGTGCITCSGSATSCTVCGNVTGIPYFYESDDTLCLIKCPSRMYGKISDNTCYSCS